MDTQKLPKDREDRYDRGVTRLEIVKYVMQYEKGIEEPKIRKYLQGELGISGLRGIKIHLEKLETEEILVKTAVSGGPNIWTLNYASGYQLGQFLVDEIFLPLSINKADYKRLCSLFKSPGFSYYLKIWDDDTWKSRIYDYLLIDTPEKININLVVSFYPIFWESIRESPSLFFEMYYPSTSMNVLSALIYLHIKKNINAYEIEYPDVISKLLAPFILDYCKYDEIGPILIGHLTVIAMRYPIAEGIDAIFKELIMAYNDFILSLLSINAEIHKE